MSSMQQYLVRLVVALIVCTLLMFGPYLLSLWLAENQNIILPRWLIVGVTIGAVFWAFNYIVGDAMKKINDEWKERHTNR